MLLAADPKQNKGASASGTSHTTVTYTLNYFVSLHMLPARKNKLMCFSVVSASHELAKAWRIREGCYRAPGQGGSVLWWHLLANQKGTNPLWGRLSSVFSIPEHFMFMMHPNSKSRSYDSKENNCPLRQLLSSFWIWCSLRQCLLCSPTEQQCKIDAFDKQ